MAEHKEEKNGLDSENTNQIQQKRLIKSQPSKVSLMGKPRTPKTYL
jgi:hypothetical protein